MNDMRDQQRVVDALKGSNGTASIGDIKLATGIHGKRVEKLLLQLGDDVGKLRGHKANRLLLKRH